MVRTFAAMLLAAAGGSAAAAGMQPGLWEFNEEAYVKEGVMRNGPLKNSYTRCVKAAEAAQPEAWYSSPRDRIGKPLARAGCNYKKSSKVGPANVKNGGPLRFGWEYACPKVTTKGEGWASVGATSMTSQDEMSRTDQKPPIVRTTTTVGKRVGACK